jgi:hypothetical protein
MSGSGICWLRRALYLSAAAAALPGALAAQDWRRELGEDRAVAVEAIVKAAYPGATVTWKGRTVVQFPDGRSRQLSLPGFRRFETGSGPLVVSCVEFEEDRKNAVRLLQNFEPVDMLAVTRLVTARPAGGSGGTAQRARLLDEAAPVTECRKIEVEEWNQSGGRTPKRIRIQYETMQGGPDWYGAVEWSATVDIESLTEIRRVPVIFRLVRDSGVSVTDAVASRSSPGGQTEFVGVSSGRVIHRCSEPCRVPASAVWALR